MNKIKKFLKGYLSGPFLLPWIWVFGLILINSVLIWIANTKETVEITEKIPSIKNEYFTTADILKANFIFLILNYTISYFARAKHVRIQTLLFVITLFYTILSMTIYWTTIANIF